MPDVTPHMSIEELRALHAQHAPKKKGRFNNEVVVDDETGNKVHSKHELGQLQLARRRLRAGEIDMLATQVWFKLEGSIYIADLVFGNVVSIDGVPHLRLTVEDPKGYVDTTAKLKKRGMKERYGIDVKFT